MSTSDFSRFDSIGASVAMLLHPYAEVVLHNLATGKIERIWNAFSRRQVGDLSLIEDDPRLFETETVLGPYEKVGLRGEIMKSITAVLPGTKRSDPPAGLLCINLDVTHVDQAIQLMRAFAAPREQRPSILFRNDWRETMQEAVSSWVTERGLSARALTRPEKIELVAALDSQALFETRNAVDHLGQILQASRASIYGYINHARARAKDGASV